MPREVNIKFAYLIQQTAETKNILTQETVQKIVLDHHEMHCSTCTLHPSRLYNQQHQNIHFCSLVNITLNFCALNY